jgi:hypothetical protein
MNRLLAAGALAAFLVAIIVIALASLDSGGGGTRAVTTVVPTHTQTRTQPTKTAPKPPRRIALVAVGPYDPPPGDGTENDDQVVNVVDGDAATFWSTEHYTHGFQQARTGSRRSTKRSRGRRPSDSSVVRRDAMCSCG